MKQEEKSLLLKDICARLPYGVRCIVDGLDDCTLMPSDIEEERDIKSYLRPLSSMTEEERKEYKHLVAFSGSPDGTANFIDWLNEKMFDYRGLIEKNIALDCTGLHIYD